MENVKEMLKNKNFRKILDDSRSRKERILKMALKHKRIVIAKNTNLRDELIEIKRLTRKEFCITAMYKVHKGREVKHREFTAFLLPFKDESLEMLFRDSIQFWAGAIGYSSDENIKFQIFTKAD